MNKLLLFHDLSLSVVLLWLPSSYGQKAAQFFLTFADEIVKEMLTFSDDFYNYVASFLLYFFTTFIWVEIYKVRKLYPLMLKTVNGTPSAFLRGQMLYVFSQFFR